MKSEPERGGADVGGEVCGPRVALPDALAQLVERRVEEGADIRLSQLRRRGHLNRVYILCCVFPHFSEAMPGQY